VGRPQLVPTLFLGSHQRRSWGKLAELKFLGYLADIAGARAKEINLGKPVALREILPASFPEKNIIILINQKAGSLDSLIRNEDRVALMPVLSGG
jgi:molybdopterin converting factor small subunit